MRHGFSVFSLWCISVQKYRNVQLLSKPFSEFFGYFHAFFHRDVLDRDERTNVQGTHSRMFATVPRHINQRVGGLCRVQGPFDDGFWGADKCVNGTVRWCPRVDVQEGNPVGRFNGLGNGIDDLRIFMKGKIQLIRKKAPFFIRSRKISVSTAMALGENTFTLIKGMVAGRNCVSS